MASESSQRHRSPLQHIADLTGAKFRVFLTEVAEGVSNYRSLHSLTQQVEHQYHGRFLIELVQNAHDALAEASDDARPSRIAIVLDLADSTYGSLLVANDGEPFTQSNFERLSQLGQSDKDPQKSIGNKGIGFRSVLEVSERPEIYSRLHRDSSSFDGYCFAFDPGLVQALVGPMQVLASADDIPPSPFSDEPIVDWSAALLRKYRDRIRVAGPDWLSAETKFLSPYLLPVPRANVTSSTVRALEAAGYATVVRLPLKSPAARRLVQQKMADLSSSALLFLDRVSILELHMPGGVVRVLSRSEDPVGEGLEKRNVRLQEDSGKPLQYSVWWRTLQVANAPFKFRAAVAALPGRWPEIQEITVSVAIRLGDKPEPGQFSIYLPTQIHTGCAVHVNAPFYGNMSRTDISFNDGYNNYLLQTAAELTAEIVRNELAGGSQDDARAIVDMVCPFGPDKLASDRWQTLLAGAFKSARGSVDGDHLFLADRGWRSFRKVSLAPDTTRTSLLTEGLIRKHATFDIFH